MIPTLIYFQDLINNFKDCCLKLNVNNSGVPFFSKADEIEQKDVSRNEMLEPPKGFYMETIVTYKEDFVPVTDRILNFLKSWTGGPGRES